MFLVLSSLIAKFIDVKDGVSYFGLASGSILLHLYLHNCMTTVHLCGLLNMM